MRSSQKKVLLLLADGFEIYEASAFMDVIGWNMVEGDQSTVLQTCALRREVKSTFGHRFTVDLVVSEVNVGDYAALAIPGGFADYDFYRDAYAADFTRLIRAFDERGIPVSSICTGALPIAKSGALTGRRGTTYNVNPIKQATMRELGVIVENDPIVVDANITTSWNPSTAIDVAFLLLERLTTKENALEVRRKMGFGR